MYQRTSASKDLASPIIIVDAVRTNQIVPIPPLPSSPIVEGKRVENNTENIKIIDVFKIFFKLFKVILIP